MGQTQSQSTGRTLDARPPTAAREPDVDPQERERIQAEERERRAAAAQQRFTSQQQRGAGISGGNGNGNVGTRKRPSALEQLSAENRGWRAADEQADLRSWN